METIRRLWARSRVLFLGGLLVAVLTLFAVAPLTYPGFFQAQSGWLPPLNVAHLSGAPDWGRAAEGLRGEGALPYLLSRLVFQLTHSGVAAVKWGYGLAFLAAGLCVYAWAHRWLGAKGAVLAAVVYTYLPWHLGTVYVRGAYAEAWLWALWPTALWAVDRLVGRRSLAAGGLGFLALAATVWVQPGLAALFLLVLVPYGAVQVVRTRRLAWALGGLLLTAVLLAIVLHVFAGDSTPFAGDFLYPFQLFSAAWGVVQSAGIAQEGPTLSEFNPAVWSKAYDTSFQLGVAALGLSIVAVALWLTSKPETRNSKLKTQDSQLKTRHPFRSFQPMLSFWSFALIAILLLTLRPAEALWRLSGFEALLHAPWQLLTFAGLPLAFLAGSTVRLDRYLGTEAAWAGIVALAILASYPYLEPRFTRVDPGVEPVALLRSEDSAAPQIMILETGIEPPTAVTPTLTLTVTWQALEPLQEDYTVFVHLLAGETKIAQLDVRPCGGECPTNAWQSGDLIVDHYMVTLPAGPQPEPLHLALGLYQLDSGERAIVEGHDDRAVHLRVPWSDR